MEKRKGIWVPIEFMENTALDWNNKILLTEISSLHELPNGCFASNEYFGSLLGITKSSASKRITLLTSLGYIKTKNISEKGKCVGRVITLAERKKKSDTLKKASEQQKGSSPENHEVVPEQPEGSSSTTTGVVPEQPGSGSLTTRGVVPQRLGGSSTENTINTITNTDILKELKKEKTLKQIPEHNTGENLDISSNNKNKEISDLHKMRAAMNEWFEEYPTWEKDLYKLGIDEFILKTAKKYGTRDPESIKMIKWFMTL